MSVSRTLFFSVSMNLVVVRQLSVARVEHELGSPRLSLIHSDFCDSCSTTAPARTICAGRVPFVRIRWVWSDPFRDQARFPTLAQYAESKKGRL